MNTQVYMAEHLDVKEAKVPKPPYQVWITYLWISYCIMHKSYYSMVFLLVQQNMLVVDTNIKFSHKNQIKSYGKKSSPSLQIFLKKTLNDKLVFLFSLLNITNTT